MAGEYLLPVAAVSGMMTLTLVSAWLLLRREPGSDAILGGEQTEVTDDEPATARSVSADDSAAKSIPAGAPPPLDADGETVACRHCGAENRPTFRYCRWCVRSGFAGEETDATAGPTMTERSL